MSAEQSTRRPRDVGFYVVIAMVVVTAIWLLLIPFSPSVAMANMKRFHLRNDSFGVWAAHFPLPSMYNFANTFEVRDTAPGMIDPILDESSARYINHFPVRLFTFGDGRARYLNSGQHLWLEVTSQYQGQTLTTTIHANRTDDADEDGFEYEFVRLPGQEPAQ